MMNPGVDLLVAANWDAAAMKFYEEFYEAYNEPIPELTGVMPEVPDDASQMTDDGGQNTEDTEVESALEPEVLEPGNSPAPAEDEQAQAVEVNKGKKFLGLGVMGATGIVLGVILLVVVLGTVAISPHRKGQL